MPCTACGRFFHDECEYDDCDECHPDYKKIAKSLTESGHSHGEVGRPTKDPEDVTDKLSTGRKRAAQLYPLYRENKCEWQGKKNCGGGSSIVGCIEGLQVHRHHGPVKDTLRNEPGNVHRICNNCHARWHAVNDPLYNEEDYNEKPHAPVVAEEIELIANEAYWRTRR